MRSLCSLLLLPLPKSLFLIACAVGIALSGFAGSAAAALFDFGDGSVQGGWAGIDPASPFGVSDGIEIVLSGTGPNGYDDRDRGSNGLGGGTESDMWRDFIFAVPDDNQIDGLQIDVSGLMPGALYEVTIWSFDSAGAQVDSRVSEWNGVAYAFSPSGELPMTLDDQNVMFQVQADASGFAQVIGDSFESSDPGVFLNGMRIVVLPEPAMALLLGLGLGMLSAIRGRGTTGVREA